MERSGGGGVNDKRDSPLRSTGGRGGLISSPTPTEPRGRRCRNSKRRRNVVAVVVVAAGVAEGAVVRDAILNVEIAEGAFHRYNPTHT